jgi:hypothetical protein
METISLSTVLPRKNSSPHTSRLVRSTATRMPPRRPPTSTRAAAPTANQTGLPVDTQETVGPLTTADPLEMVALPDRGMVGDTLGVPTDLLQADILPKETVMEAQEMEAQETVDQAMEDREIATVPMVTHRLETAGPMVSQATGVPAGTRQETTRVTKEIIMVMTHLAMEHKTAMGHPLMEPLMVMGHPLTELLVVMEQPATELQMDMGHPVLEPLMVMGHPAMTMGHQAMELPINMGHPLMKPRVVTGHQVTELLVVLRHPVMAMGRQSMELPMATGLPAMEHLMVMVRRVMVHPTTMVPLTREFPVTMEHP